MYERHFHLFPQDRCPGFISQESQFCGEIVEVLTKAGLDLVNSMREYNNRKVQVKPDVQ